jgi:hypothetical protein
MTWKIPGLTALMVLALPAATAMAAAPDPGSGSQPPGTEKLLTLLKWLAWCGYAACVAGVILAAIGLVMEHKGRGSGGGSGQLVMVLIGALLIGAASKLVDGAS